ncbi:hypothetical protein [Nonomuraea sp. SBT364]|uniref:hypothetical protein n=1 Tax=Nonomuraea sp. SBT364 TaxID=1580530 RepID=UPI00066AB3E9|nr:hypothetical protein [Nonomuraea sp. SBT364]
MSILDMQRAFGRMLTDKAFQRMFLDGDPAATEPYRLTEAELASLRGLDRGRLALQAELLANSRLELALGALPLTSLLLHHQLHDHVDRFCAEFPPVPESLGAMIVEAERLCEFAVRLLREGTLEPVWAEDVVAYERVLLDLSTSGEAWAGAATIALLNDGIAAPSAEDLPGLVPVTAANTRIVPFFHDLAELVPRLEDGEIPAGVTRLERPQLLLFVKRPGAVFVRRMRVNAATAALLEASDGRRTVAEVCAAVAGASGPGALSPPARQAALDMLLLLRDHGAIGLRPRMDDASTEYDGAAASDGRNG